MAETVREKIIQKFTTRAAAILKTGGFNTDVGQRVFRAQPTIAPGETPCVNIWPQAESVDRKYGQEEISMEVVIEGIHAFTADKDTGDASKITEEILGDLRKAFTDPVTRATTYSTLVSDVVYTSGGPATYPGESARNAGARISVLIRYSTLTGNPYSQ